MKVRQLFEKYRFEYLERSAINPERAVHAWKRLGPVFGRMDAERLSAGSVARYKSNRQASPGTINRELGVLSAALKWGAAQGYISTISQVARMRTPEPRQRVLSEEEISSMLKAAEPWPYVSLFIKIALLTGQRKEAILSLRWDQINDGIIDFRSSNLQVSERRKGRSVLPVSKELGTILEDARNRQGERADTAHSPWVICLEQGFRCCGFRRSWAKVVEAAGLSGTGVTPHTLRHTAATRLISKGGTLVETARFLGHRSVRTTEQVYIKWQPEYLEKAVEIVSIEGL